MGSPCSGGAGCSCCRPGSPRLSLLPGDLRWLRVNHQLDLKAALMARNAEHNVGSVCFIYAAAFYELSHCLSSSEVNFIGHSKPRLKDLWRTRFSAR